MILWGFRKGKPLDAIQVVGFVAAVIGLLALVFPGLSTPPLIGSILMLGAGAFWGGYSVRGKGVQEKIRPALRQEISCVLFRFQRLSG